jgi:hypothetical protein
MSPEVLFLKPKFVPQAQGSTIVVAVKAEEPRAFQAPAQAVIRVNVRS